MKQRHRSAGTRFYGWQVAVGCFLFLLCSVTLVGYTAGLFVTPICEDLGIETTNFLTLYTVCSLSSAASMTFLTPKLQKGNMRVILLLAATAMMGGFTFYGYCQKLWQFWLSGAVMSVGLAFFLKVVPAMLVTNWFDDKRSIVLSLVTCANGIGGAIWAQILAKIIQTNGWRMAYRITGPISFVVMVLIIVFLLKKSPSEYGQKPYGSGNRNVQVAAETRKHEGMDQKTAFRTPMFGMMGLRQLLVGLYASAVTGHLITFLLCENWDYMKASGVLSIYQLVMVVGLVLSGIVINRIGLKKSCLCFGVPLVLGALSLGLTSWIGVFAYGYAIFGGLCGAIMQSIPALLTFEVFGERDYTAIFSILGVFNMVGSAAGSYVLGLMADTMGYTLSFIIMTCMCVIVVIFDAVVLAMSKNFRCIYSG